MKTNQFDHDLTPEKLKQINRSIVELLGQEDEGEKFPQLHSLIESRDLCIQSHLSELDEESRRAFAQNELVINDRLKEMAQSLLKSAKQDVTQYLRSQAAIKKYK